MVRAEVIRSFTDCGTGKRFAKGAKPLLSEGTFDNYAAAGLVRAAPAPKRRAHDSARSAG